MAVDDEKGQDEGLSGSDDARDTTHGRTHASSAAPARDPGGPPPARVMNHPPNSPISSSSEGDQPSAREILIANAKAPFPEKLVTIAERFGYKASYLKSLAYQLRAAGLMPATQGVPAKYRVPRQKNTTSYRRRKGPPQGGAPLVDRGAPESQSEPAKLDAGSSALGQLKDILGSGTELSQEQRRAVLAILATHGQQNVMVAAVRALEDMDRQQGRQVGPPPPSSDEDQIQRATRLLECIGRTNGEEAFRRVQALWSEVEAVDRGVRLDDGGAGQRDGSRDGQVGSRDAADADAAGAAGGEGGDAAGAGSGAGEQDL